MDSLSVSVLQDTRAMAVIAQVGPVDILGSTLECMGWLSHLSNLSFIPCLFLTTSVPRGGSLCLWPWGLLTLCQLYQGGSWATDMHLQGWLHGRWGAVPG